jgi:putative ABC transport system permease protein
MHNLRYAVRMLVKKPGFTVIAVLALALGIGANTAIFGVVQAVLLRPLPYRQPDRLVMLWQKITGATSFPAIPCSVPDYIDYRDQTRTLENVAAFVNSSFNLVTPSGADRVAGTSVSANLFPLLAIAPLRGRVFTAAEDRPGNDQVVVLSYGTWKRRFGSDPDILGKTLVLDHQPRQVIGVMPREFNFPADGLVEGPPPEFWVPIAFTPAQLGPDARGDNFNISAIARRKPGVSIQQASSDLDRVARRIYEGYPLSTQKLFSLNAFVTDLHEHVVGKVRPLLAVLLGAVGFVLLIGCANVANLLLAKAAGRRREMAIRIALGAGRARVLGQLLTESVLLGLVGGAAGLLVAVWLTQLLIHFSPGDVPRLAESQLNLSVTGFALAISILTGVLFGLAPAIQISKTDLNIDLKERGRGATAFRRSRLRGALVIGEVALSLMLLAGAGLLVRSFVKLRNVSIGFRPDHVLTFSVALPEVKYQSKVQIQSFYRTLLERIQASPDVKSAAAATNLPLLSGQWNIIITPEGQKQTDKKSLDAAFFTGVSLEFHHTMGIELKRGRLFTPADQDPTRPVAIVNEAMARHYWPDQEVLGKRFKWGPEDNSRAWITIVGVSGDVRQSNLAAHVSPGVYMPILAMPQDSAVSGLNLVVRTAADPTAVIANLREIVRSLDPEVPMFQVRPMDEVLSESVAPRRFNMLLLAAFAGLALLLASIGIYGVMSYSVSQYTHEIGIRMALGARAADVLQLIVRQGMLLVAAGLAIGLAGALALTRVMSSLLFDVEPADPLTFAAVSALLAAVAFAASYIPARRATRVDPMVALRYE